MQAIATRAEQRANVIVSSFSCLRLFCLLSSLFHILNRSEHKVGLTALDEPLAVLLHVGVVIAHTSLVLLAIANQRHITIGNARSRITVNVNRLLSVQVINHIEQGEIVGKSLANLLFTFHYRYFLLYFEFLVQ